MASKAVVDAVIARLGASFTFADQSSVVVKTPNDTDPTPPADGAAFLTVQFPVVSAQHVGMAGVGNRTFRETGAIRLVLSVPLGSGYENPLTRCDELAALFRAQVFDGVHCLTPSPAGDNGKDVSGAYWLFSVSVPYFYDLLA